MFLGLLLCSAGLLLLLSPAQYQATVKIKSGPDASSDIMGNGHSMIYDAYFIQIQLDIIQSPLVLSNVVESLNLDSEWGKKYGAGSPLQTTKTIKLLQRRIRLEPIRNTMLLNVSFFGDNPNEAARIANAIAKAYCDYRSVRHREGVAGGIRFLTGQYQREEQEIKAKQENLQQLGKQLNLPNPEPADELLESNYASYYQARRSLQNLIGFHKLLAARIETEKNGNFQIPITSLVEIVEAAKLPEFPSGPNRWLGVTLLAIGLFPAIGGFLLLKSSLRQSF